MANPRQRRKARSSTHKAVSHSSRAKKLQKKMPAIRGPKALQDAWDRHKTVKQNYAALGLIHTLNPSASGGVEKVGLESSSKVQVQNAEPSTSTVAASTSTVTLGRIIRDADGNVLRVEMPEEEECEEDVMQEPKVPEDVVEKWVTDLGHANDGTKPTVRNVVPALERISAAPSKQTTTLSIPITGIPRHSSFGETAYLQRLRDKYGDNVEKMARDRKLNSDQKTAAQLIKAMKRASLIQP